LRTAGRSGLSNTLFRIRSCMDGSGDERRKTKPVGAYVFFSGEYTPPSCATAEEAPGWYAKWPKLGSRSEGLIGWLAWLVELGPLPECMLKDHTLLIIVVIKRDRDVLGGAHSRAGADGLRMPRDFAFRCCWCWWLSFLPRPATFLFACGRAHVDLFDVASKGHHVLLPSALDLFSKSTSFVPCN
jgi:hypothetical protein